MDGQYGTAITINPITMRESSCGIPQFSDRTVLADIAAIVAVKTQLLIAVLSGDDYNGERLYAELWEKTSYTFTHSTRRMRAAWSVQQNGPIFASIYDDSPAGMLRRVDVLLGECLAFGYVVTGLQLIDLLPLPTDLPFVPLDAIIWFGAVKAEERAEWEAREADPV